MLQALRTNTIAGPVHVFACIECFHVCFCVWHSPVREGLKLCQGSCASANGASAMGSETCFDGNRSSLNQVDQR